MGLPDFVECILFYFLILTYQACFYFADLHAWCTRGIQYLGGTCSYQLVYEHTRYAHPQWDCMPIIFGLAFVPYVLEKLLAGARSMTLGHFSVLGFWDVVRGLGDCVSMI